MNVHLSVVGPTVSNIKLGPTLAQIMDSHPNLFFSFTTTVSLRESLRVLFESATARVTPLSSDLYRDARNQWPLLSERMK
jgi:hypothetical protein